MSCRAAWDVVHHIVNSVYLGVKELILPLPLTCYMMMGKLLKLTNLSSTTPILHRLVEITYIVCSALCLIDEKGSK